MKKIIIYIAALCSIYYAQSMEIVQPKKNKKNIPTLKLNMLLIDKLTNDSKKNKSDPSLFLRRAKKLHLLQELLSQHAEIAFSNNDSTVTFWQDKKDDEMIKKILYDKLLCFVSYNKSSPQQIIQINSTHFKQKPPFNAVLHLSPSLLHIANTYPLTDQFKKTVLQFLHHYSSDIIIEKTTNNFSDKNYQQQDTQITEEE